MVFVGCSLTAVWVWGWLRSLPVFPALPRGAMDREAEPGGLPGEGGREMARRHQEVLELQLSWPGI